MSFSLIDLTEQERRLRREIQELCESRSYHKRMVRLKDQQLAEHRQALRDSISQRNART